MTLSVLHITSDHVNASRRYIGRDISGFDGSIWVMPCAGRVVFDTIRIRGNLIIGAESWVESLHGIQCEGSIHGTETLKAATSINARGALVILTGDIEASSDIDADSVTALRGSIVTGRNLVSISTIMAGRAIQAGQDMIAEGNVHSGGDITVFRKLLTEGGVFTGGHVKAGHIAVRNGIVSAGSLLSEDVIKAGSVTANGTLKSKIFEVRESIAANQAGQPEQTLYADKTGITGTVLCGFDIWSATAPLAMAQSTEALHRRFLILADEWRLKRALVSSIERMTKIPEYQEIIRMGVAATPWIIDQLRAQPDHWFPALEAVTGVNPVKTSSEGHMAEMASDWCAWFEQNGTTSSAREGEPVLIG